MDLAYSNGLKERGMRDIGIKTSTIVSVSPLGRLVASIKGFIKTAFESLMASFVGVMVTDILANGPKERKQAKGYIRTNSVNTL